MIDYFNFWGLKFIDHFYYTHVIIKKYEFHHLYFWRGWTFVYTIPIYINFTREMYLIGDQARIFSNPH